MPFEPVVRDTSMLPIAPEGRPYLAQVAVLVALAHFFLGVWALPTWLLLIAALVMFRDMPRKTPPNPLAVVSPVDAVVTAVRECHDPFLDRRTTCVTLQQRRFGEFNVHSPIEGKFQQYWAGGEGQEVAEAEGRFAIWLQTDEKEDVVMATDRRRWPHRLSILVHAGERLGQGRRCGFLGFWRPVELYLPDNARVDVKPGQTVLAGVNVIATLLHKKEPTGGS